MAHLQVDREVVGPWSLATSLRFWEGFAPAALATQAEGELRTVFLCDADWCRVEARVRQDGPVARIDLDGEGDLDAAAAQVARFLALDVDGRGWPDVGRADPVVGQAQAALPGFRPCGFFSPYEAAVWAVLSQRIRMAQAAATRARLLREHGEDGAFPSPSVLRRLDEQLPGRRLEYLHAVAEAALDGAGLRAEEPAAAMASVQRVAGLGPFAAQLVVLRGANASDGVATNEQRLAGIVARRYDGRTIEDVSDAWRPYRTWAAVHLRAVESSHLG